MKVAPAAAAATAAALALPVAPAHARAALDEHGPGVRQRPAERLREAACELDVELRGAVAVVEQRQRIANPGPSALGASVELELPAGAQLVDAALRGVAPAAAAAAVLVDASAPTVRPTPGVLGLDPALVARRPGGAVHAILQPIAPHAEVVLVTRYVALATPRAGALRLVLPGRATAAGPALPPCRGTVRAAPGPGASVRRILVGGAATPGGRPAPLALDASELAIHVELDVPGARPVAWVQSQPLADGWSASVVTVLGPAARRPGHRRVVLVIDGSRSMDLVGRHRVAAVVRQIGAALPAEAELEAILFDRRAARVFGELRPATPQNLAAIEAEVNRRAAGNGTDVAGALALAGQAIAGQRGPSTVVLVTDGVLGDTDGPALARALGGKTSTVDVHAIVLDPARTTSPGGAALRGPVHLYGGAYAEVAADELADALSAIDEWLRPAWLELRLGEHPIPTEVRAGGGFAHTLVHRGPPRFTLTGRGEAAFAIAPAAAPAAPIAALALAAAGPAAFTGSADPTEADVIVAEPTRARALAAHPLAEGARAFAVLSTTGRVARSRREVVLGGGRYERVTAGEDPQPTLAAAAAAAPVPPSAIARETLERLFRDQLQPSAYGCYQRALGRDPKLAGTARFQLRLGRGEVTQVSLVGLGDAQLDACLLDAAYALTPPLPDFAVNADDQTIANYPLTLQRRGEQPVIVLGDADSTSPLDIDAIEGGVPGAPRAPRARPDDTTPLGGLRPPPSP